MLKDEGYTVPQIRKITNHHDNNIRKWIHHFNEKGIVGHSYQKSTVINSTNLTDEIEKQIVDITSANPKYFMIWDFPPGHYVYLLVFLYMI